ncbi:RagB/SusD family nutrient uptake outer membrane protein [Flavihumibacter rivuli]|nr:RagB/SusD family nutrient uptake outer membrane protein [Flavihumibacter rivuli]ULQ55288.1 RagB/SusD family nutrient uptake outer membrane protein [Flavihumibacter rivuli]
MKLRSYRIGAALLLATAIAGVSCSKYLDRPPQGQILEEEALKDEAGLQRVVNGAYITLGSETFYGGRTVVISELLSDELDGTLLTEDFGEIYGRRTSIFGAYKNDFYSNSYRIVANMNKVLANLDKASAAKDQIEGEAKFIRAMVHFELVRLYAQPYGFTPDNSHLGVPVRISSDVNIANRASVQEVYNQIIADLNDAAAKLSSGATTVASKDAANALLAKVYFQMNKFAEAYAAANDALSGAKPYQFVKSDTAFTTRFSVGKNKEAILLISAQQNNPQGSLGNGLRDQFRSDTRRPTLFVNNETFNKVANTGDKRAIFVSNTLQAGINVITKYNSDVFELPVLHVTELKLIRAEAGAAAGGAALATAIQDVNDILERAYGNTSRNLPTNAAAADVIRVAREQRFIEMVGEGNRIQEIKRIGALTGQNVDGRGARWNCPGLAIQFPQGEMASNTEFVRNPEGGCN